MDAHTIGSSDTGMPPSITTSFVHTHYAHTATTTTRREQTHTATHTQTTGKAYAYLEAYNMH